MDHLAQLERKCGEASSILDRLGSVSADGTGFIKGELLFNAEERAREMKENLAQQNRELSQLTHAQAHKQERLQEVKLHLDQAKLRHTSLLEQIDQTKRRHHDQLGEEDVLREKQTKLGKRLDDITDKLHTLERLQKSASAVTSASSAAATVATAAEGGLESFLRQSELFKRLGLSVSKLPKEKIRVSFHLIDPLDHQRQFSFLVYVQDEQYFVEDVRPALASGNLPEMVRELNANNDFSWFTRSMRRKFQDTCSSSSSSSTGSNGVRRG